MRTVVATALSVGLLAGPALADLTAEEVLADQLNLLSFFGELEVKTTGTRVTSQGLVIDGFVATYRNEDAVVRLRYDGVELIEERDDRVRVVYPDEVSVTVTSDAEPHAVTITLALEDVDHVVTGTEDVLEHTFDARRIAFVDIEGMPDDAELNDTELTFFLEGLTSTLRFVDGASDARSMAFSLERVRISVLGEQPKPANQADVPDGELFRVGVVDVSFEVAGSNGTIGFVGSDVPRYSMEAAFDRLDWQQKMVTETEGEMTFGMVADDFSLSYDFALSIEALEKSFPDAMQNGQFATAEMRYGASEFEMSMNLPDGPVRMVSSSGAADLAFGLSSNGLSLSTSAQDTVFDIIVPPNPAMPFSQAGYQVGSVGYGFTMPVLAKDEPQRFAFDVMVDDLTVSDALWDLFDSERRIPRDPVDLVIDLNGTTVVSEDPFLAEDGVVPFAQTEATLNDLRLAIGGAVLAGAGQVTDTSTPGKASGFGSLSAVLTGGNTLLDTLVDMGLVDTDQAMGARMMLGVVARAGDGPDTLISEIEVTEDGQILANGQRIR